ncbi:MAG: GTPase Era [Gemmatimonadetes bacterium]|nr:GTPase Era [Gemmatimonadota bacterium]
MTRCGAVAIVGRPNAGKSTLLNALVGAHLAIVSPRPQSTRLPVVGVCTRDEAQAIFIDTPGLLEPGYALHRAMRETIRDALANADVILHLVDSTAPDPAALTTALAELELLSVAPRIITAWTKADIAHPETSDLRIASNAGTGLDLLWHQIRERLPVAEFQHPADDLSTQPLRFFVTEAIREAAFEQLREEMPYAIHAEVEEFREAASPVYIRVTLYVERESQKGIVVGKGGAQLRSLGIAARARLEPLVGGPVYLDLWVKVLKDWRRDVATLRRLGFLVPDTVP